jgi:hypothetical protein
MSLIANDGYKLLAEAGFIEQKTNGDPLINITRNANGNITVSLEDKLQTALFGRSIR